MKRRRAYCAWAIFGVTFAAAVWLITYRITVTVEYIEYVRGIRHHFHPSEQVRTEPWWAAPATVALLVLGVGAALRVLPEGRGPIRRLADHFARVSNRNSRRRPTTVS